MSALAVTPTLPSPARAAAAPFCWDISSRHWTWSPEMYRLHGYELDACEASTEQTLAHVLHGWVDAMHEGMHNGHIVAHEHRVVDGAGQTRPVLLVALPAARTAGPVTRVDGMLLSLEEADEVTGPADEAPELVLLVMGSFGLGQAVARALLRCCFPVPAGWARRRLQVVGDDGLAGSPSGSLSDDVAAVLFPSTAAEASAS